MDLVSRLKATSQRIFPQRERDGHAYHETAYLFDEAATEIETLRARVKARDQALRNSRAAFYVFEESAEDAGFLSILPHIKARIEEIDALLADTKMEGGDGE